MNELSIVAVTLTSLVVVPTLLCPAYGGGIAARVVATGRTASNMRLTVCNTTVVGNAATGTGMCRILPTLSTALCSLM